MAAAHEQWFRQIKIAPADKKKAAKPNSVQSSLVQ
jgi:hypothetical protein